MADTPQKPQIAAAKNINKGDRTYYATLVKTTSVGPNILLLTYTYGNAKDALHEVDCPSRFPDDIRELLVGQLRQDGHKYIFPDRTARARELASQIYNARPPYEPGLRDRPLHLRRTVPDQPLAG